VQGLPAISTMTRWHVAMRILYRSSCSP
jgi:hypothetical protein